MIHASQPAAPLLVSALPVRHDPFNNTHHHLDMSVLQVNTPLAFGRKKAKAYGIVAAISAGAFDIVWGGASNASIPQPPRSCTATTSPTRPSPPGTSTNDIAALVAQHGAPGHGGFSLGGAAASASANRVTGGAPVSAQAGVAGVYKTACHASTCKEAGAHPVARGAGADIEPRNNCLLSCAPIQDRSWRLRMP